MKETIQHDAEQENASSISRRKFLNYAGAIAGAGILIASCKKDDDNNTTTPTGEGTVDLGSDDHGLLNYAYLIKQLKASFYTQALKTPFPGMTATEAGFFTDMRDHEIAHREFLKNYLANNAIPVLENDFSSIDFGLKNSVLAKSKQFEELSTAALAGICKLLTFSDSLMYVLKMISVDARHSAIINDFIYMGAFAEKADANGMEISQDPQSSLESTRKYFKRTISGAYVPKY